MKPVIAISIGDPGGIGPEVTLKAVARPEIKKLLTPLIVGDEKILRELAQKLQLPFELETLKELPTSPIDKPSLYQPGSNCEERLCGHVCAANGSAAVAYIKTAAKLVLDKHADAICTAPISKEAIKLAGFTYPGHTELLAELCGLDTVRMMMVGGGLKVVLQTIHVALKDVPSLLSRDAILQSLHIIRDFAFSTGMRNPRVGVCGLNPHAGENGQFGREEVEIIAPAIRAARNEGLKVTGPIPADTIYHRALEGQFDFVLAMYHDQALIPVKTLDFHGGVNVTLGLPLIRTSPDHGTAFDLSGKGIANESSMTAALKLAAQLASNR